MRNSKKLIITALAVILLLGATPLAAQLAGTWAGTGRGSCCPHPGVTIYPWQEWKGEIPNSEDVFTGEWWDSNGNQGIFKGEIDWPSITVAVAKGSWYWYDPTGPAKPVYGGDFEMKFYPMASIPPYCNGTWTSIWPSPGLPGTMRGRKVD
jgi:hypothetical protein